TAHRPLIHVFHHSPTFPLCRYVRGWVGRRVGVAKKVELNLTDRVSKLADELMCHGDIWVFLQKVDENYRRYERVIDDMQTMEDSMAASFVRK
ncbi:unnamed protein product, partial [Choristocarpus tenellus]